jgi:hypothetical protein
MNKQLRQFMKEHWVGMLTDEQIDAWNNPDIWGTNYTLTPQHAMESVEYFLNECEENKEVKQLHKLIWKDIDWSVVVTDVAEQSKKETTL